MNKRIILSLSLMLTIIISNAQSLKLGIKAGAIGTKIAGESFKSGYNLSYQAGAWAEIDLLGKIGVQPELLFSQTSSSYTSGTPTIPTDVNVKVKLNYLSIPVLFRYNVAKIITLNLGPQFSILMNKDDNLLDNGKAAFKGGDFAAVAGVQLHISSLRVYGRYVLGLSNINDNPLTSSGKSQQIQIGVGFKVF